MGPGGRVKNAENERSFAAHQNSCLTENPRKGVNEVHNRAQAINKFSIFVPILFEDFHILLKKKEDRTGGVAALDLIGEGVVFYIYPSLLHVLI